MVNTMKTTTVSSPQIREDILGDPRYPIHRIASQLRPYLQILVDQFHPEQVILFGSYAYGEPTPDSDVDLLIVKEITSSPVTDATRIRRAVRHLRHTVANLPLDIMVRSPDDWRERLNNGASFHNEIHQRGLRLV
jgi:predicted nucleotidyltransferase